MYKSEIVRNFPGMTEHDFRKWLQIPKHRQALLNMGVRPTAHKLPVKAVQYIIDNY